MHLIDFVVIVIVFCALTIFLGFAFLGTYAECIFDFELLLLERLLVYRVSFRFGRLVWLDTG